VLGHVLFLEELQGTRGLLWGKTSFSQSKRIKTVFEERLRHDFHFVSEAQISEAN
jgi:hypothetical protein